jgi:hypothetical protein
VIKVGLRQLRQIGAVWEVLAQETVRVFIGSALPRALRIAKVDFDIGCYRMRRRWDWHDGRCCAAGHRSDVTGYARQVVDDREG